MIKNVFYLFKKSILFFIFGFSSITFAIFVCPILLYITKNKPQPDRVIRASVSLFFRSLLKISSVINIVKVNVNNKELLDNAEDMIICGNHPTFLDVVILMSLIPKADCIVRADLWENIFFKRMVSRLYIPSDQDAESTILDCVDSLNKNRHLVLFPEGTRTKNNTIGRVKRSAAHISLRSGHSILPISIKVSETGGYGKGDSFFDIPKKHCMYYDVTILEPINPNKYSDISIPLGARQLTEELKTVIVRYGEKSNE